MFRATSLWRGPSDWWTYSWANHSWKIQQTNIKIRLIQRHLLRLAMWTVDQKEWNCWWVAEYVWKTTRGVHVIFGVQSCTWQNGRLVFSRTKTKGIRVSPFCLGAWLLTQSGQNYTDAGRYLKGFPKSRPRVDCQRSPHQSCGFSIWAQSSDPRLLQKVWDITGQCWNTLQRFLLRIAVRWAETEEFVDKKHDWCCLKTVQLNAILIR